MRFRSHSRFSSILPCLLRGYPGGGYGAMALRGYPRGGYGATALLGYAAPWPLGTVDPYSFPVDSCEKIIKRGGCWEGAKEVNSTSHHPTVSYNFFHI